MLCQVWLQLRDANVLPTRKERGFRDQTNLLRSVRALCSDKSRNSDLF